MFVKKQKSALVGEPIFVFIFLDNQRKDRPSYYIEAENETRVDHNNHNFMLAKATKIVN